MCKPLICKPLMRKPRTVKVRLAVLDLLQFFFDSSRTTASFSEIVQFCLPNIAAPLHRNTFDQWAVGLESSLNADAVGNLSKDKSRIQPSIFLSNDHAFECL
jgi:hypothetical protein